MAPSFVSYNGMVIAILVMAIIGTLLLLALILSRMVRLRREGIAAERIESLRPLLLEIASGEDDDGSAAQKLSEVSEAERPLVVDAALRLLAKVKGLPAVALTEVLGSLGVPERVNADLHSSSEVKRARAAWDAGLMGMSDKVPELIELLDDHSGTVRLTAVRALGKLGDASATAGVLASAADRGRRSAISAPVVVEALMGLGPDAADTIGASLTAPDAQTRIVAAQAVGSGQHTGLGSQLHEALANETSDEARVSQLWAIGQIGLPSDAVLAADYLAADYPRKVRMSALEAVSVIGDPRVTATIVPVLSDADRRVAAHAADALATLGEGGVACLREAVRAGGTAGRAAGGALDRYELRANAGEVRR